MNNLEKQYENSWGNEKEKIEQKLNELIIKMDDIEKLEKDKENLKWIEDMIRE